MDIEKGSPLRSEFDAWKASLTPEQQSQSYLQERWAAEVAVDPGTLRFQLIVGTPRSEMEKRIADLVIRNEIETAFETAAILRALNERFDAMWDVSGPRNIRRVSQPVPIVPLKPEGWIRIGVENLSTEQPSDAWAVEGLTRPTSLSRSSGQ